MRETTIERRAFLTRLSLVAGGALAGASLLVAGSGCGSLASLASPPAAEPAAVALTVDAAACVGCKRCVAVAPTAYRMDPQTRKAEAIPGASAAGLEAGARACPVNATH